MIKLSLIMAFIFSFLAFARADEGSGKLRFAASLCALGGTDQQTSCLQQAERMRLSEMSFFRIAADLCPLASQRGRIVLRCLNKANERFGLSIRFCNQQQTYRTRVECVRAVFTQADNQIAISEELPPRGSLRPRDDLGRDDSLRGDLPKAKESPAVPSPAPGAVSE